MHTLPYPSRDSMSVRYTKYGVQHPDAVFWLHACVGEAVILVWVVVEGVLTTMMWLGGW
jgi:hypothetical protein